LLWRWYINCHPKRGKSSRELSCSFLARTELCLLELFDEYMNEQMNEMSETVRKGIN
jgi:hypothetical protein